MTINNSIYYKLDAIYHKILQKLSYILLGINHYIDLKVQTQLLSKGPSQNKHVFEMLFFLDLLITSFSS